MKATRLVFNVAVLAALGLVAQLVCTAGAMAQYGPGAGGRAPYSQGGGRNEAGRFDYYALVLSWSPTFCASNGDRRGNELQCNRRDGRRYAFVLHGLWPQHERGWPENCPTRDRPFVPNSTIDKMLDIMPSKGLIIHEYKKHGTCSGLSPNGYYEQARKMFDKVKIPPRYVKLNQGIMVAPGELVRDFVAANPGMKPDMMGIVCRGSGNRLQEIRFCFSREGNPRACGRNEDQRKLCSAAKMYLPPVR